MPNPLLAGTVQPPTLTLLSSDNTILPPLWQPHTGPSPKSTIQVIADSAYPRPEGRSALHVPKFLRDPSNDIAGHVVHLQSPRVGDTYVELGDVVYGDKQKQQQPLGATLPWLGAQIKALGKRAWALEVAVTDPRGRKGRIRFETSRTEPVLLARTPPLLRLPLATPRDGVSEWCEFVVDLRQLVPLFRQLRPDTDEGDGEDGAKRKRRAAREDMPERFASVEGVRVYASCRVRRVWLASEGGVRDEWALVRA